MKKFVTDIYNDKYFQEEDIALRIPDCFWEWSLITLEPDIEKQEWLGLGGAFTVSSNFNYLKLPKLKQQEFIDSYFRENGLNYQFGRIPIGSCDFSLNEYSYLDEADLNKFTIEKDYQTILPLIKDALKKQKISFLASPWSPPKFMKDNNSLANGGILKKEYYKLYAEYLIKYLKAYQKEKINIDYLTIQNEPFAKQIWESCYYSLQEQREFIYNFLIPALKKENLKTKIFLWDHNKDRLFKNVKEIYQEKSEYIKGVAFHWYSGTYFENLELAHNTFPELLMFETECCTGFSEYDEKAWIIDACLYMNEILGNINHGMNAFIDWNLLLDFNGGPNHAENFCKSPIILNQKEDDFIKTPIYYFLKHLSLIPPSSKVIFSSIYTNELITASFKSKDGKIYTVVLNPTNNQKEICFMKDDYLMQDMIRKLSIHTYVY